MLLYHCWHQFFCRKNLHSIHYKFTIFCDAAIHYNIDVSNPTCYELMNEVMSDWLWDILNMSVCVILAHNRVPKSDEILMFGCLQKIPNNAVMPQCLIVLNMLVNTSTLSTIGCCGITALFAIFEETNKHQNLNET